MMAISSELLDYTKQKDTRKGNDRVLWPYLEASDLESGDRLLDWLITVAASPVIKRIFGLLDRRHRSQGLPPLDYEDMAQEVAMGLTKRLRILKQNPEFEPIGDYVKYVSGATTNTYNRKVLEGHPRWLILKNQVSYFLTNDPLYSTWLDENKNLLCGYASWQSSSKSSPPDVDTLVESVKRDVGDNPYPGSMPQSIPLQELAVRIFGIWNKPLRVTDFIKIVGQLWGFGGENISPGEVEKLTDVRHQSDSQSLAFRMENRQTLQFLLQEIALLPTRQRKSILYSLRAAGRSALLLMYREGIAHADQLSEMLDIPEEELESMLVNELPLSDAEIGHLLGVSAEKARNFRKSGIERLSRRLEAYEKNF